MIALPAAVGCLALSACGSDPAPSGTGIVSTIRPEVERQVAARGLEVVSLICDEPAGNRARCSAQTSGADTLPVEVTLKEAGELSWQIAPEHLPTAQGGPPGTDAVEPVYAWTTVSCEEFVAHGADWFELAASVLGQDTASRSPTLSVAAASRRWDRELRRACERATNPSYQPAGPIAQRLG